MAEGLYDYPQPPQYQIFTIRALAYCGTCLILGGVGCVVKSGGSDYSGHDTKITTVLAWGITERILR